MDIKIRSDPEYELLEEIGLVPHGRPFSYRGQFVVPLRYTGSGDVVVRDLLSGRKKTLAAQDIHDYWRLGELQTITFETTEQIAHDTALIRARSLIEMDERIYLLLNDAVLSTREREQLQTPDIIDAVDVGVCDLVSIDVDELQTDVSVGDVFRSEPTTDGRM